MADAKGPERNRIKGNLLERLRKIVPELVKGRKGGGPEGSRTDAERRLDQSFQQVKESLDLFGNKKPGQQELWSLPEPEKEKKTRAKRKTKPPPREAQLDLFTGKQEQPIQARLFQDFVKGGDKVDEKTPGEIQKTKAGTVEGAGRWVRTSPTGRVFEAPSLVAKNAGKVASLEWPIKILSCEKEKNTCGEGITNYENYFINFYRLYNLVFSQNVLQYKESCETKEITRTRL